jgi:transposase
MYYNTWHDATNLSASVTDAERQRLEAGLPSSDAFVLRRGQILLASARGEQAPQIAHHLGCHDQTVRNAIKAFNHTGLDCLRQGSSRPHTSHAAFPGEKAEQLRALLHQSPRTFGQPTNLWTLELAAEVSFQQGLTQEQVSGETIRATLARLGVRWQRAKEWTTSPDPHMPEKRGPRPADPPGRPPS